MLCQFDYLSPSLVKPDRTEKITKALLKPLRSAFGRRFQVSSSSNKPTFDEKRLSLINKVAYAILSFLIAPLTLLGLALSPLSSSHKKIYKTLLDSTGVIPKQILAEEPPGPRLTTPTKDQIMQSLKEFKNAWNLNVREVQEQIWEGKREQPLSQEKAHRALNSQLFTFVKQQRPSVKTPLDVVWGLNGFSMDEPIPMMEPGLNFTTERENFYTIDPWSDCPLKPSQIENNSFGSVIKNENNQLHLYQDGISKFTALFVNGKLYSTSEGKGLNKSILTLNEGDIVCEVLGKALTYRFTVGPNGSINYPSKKREVPVISDAARTQREEFESQLQSRRNKNDKSLSCTTNLQAAEIGLDAPLEQGFALHSQVQVRTDSETIPEVDLSHQADKGDLVFVDLEKDQVLRDLVAYLKVEFELMTYTDEEKTIRLAILAAALLDQKSSSVLPKNYLLGEVIRAGAGVCRHRSLLIKALADALDLKCALVAGVVSKAARMEADDHSFVFLEVLEGAAHVWNIMEVDGAPWIVDPMHQCAFPVSSPPGMTVSSQKKIGDWYGISCIKTP